MLETVALCTLMFDLHGLRLSFLPLNLQEEVHQELGFDPWSEATMDTMSIAIGAASDGNATKAVMALLSAEMTVSQMSSSDTLNAIDDCAERYGALISAQ